MLAEFTEFVATHPEYVNAKAGGNGPTIYQSLEYNMRLNMPAGDTFPQEISEGEWKLVRLMNQQENQERHCETYKPYLDVLVAYGARAEPWTGESHLTEDSELRMACRLRNKEGIIKAIGEGADVNARDAEGLVPMCSLVANCWWNKHERARSSGELVRDIECMRLLVEAGADIEGVDEDGTTLLGGAIWYMNTDVACFLLRNGAQTRCVHHSWGTDWIKYHASWSGCNPGESIYALMAALLVLRSVVLVPRLSPLSPLMTFPLDLTRMLKDFLY